MYASVPDPRKTELYLGVVHANDEAGTRERIEAAKAVVCRNNSGGSPCAQGEEHDKEGDINQVLLLGLSMDSVCLSTGIGRVVYMLVPSTSSCWPDARPSAGRSTDLDRIRHLQGCNKELLTSHL